MSTQTRKLTLLKATPTAALPLLTLLIGVMVTPLEAEAEIYNHQQPNVMLQAQRALERGKPDRSIQLLEHRAPQLATASLRAKAQGLLCQAHFKVRNIAAATKACDAAVKNSQARPNWSDLNNRGVMHLLSGDLEKAQEDFQQALHAHPRSRAVRRNLSLLKREQDAV